MTSLGDDLRAFIDASPSPFHAVAEMARRLGEAGFTELDEADRWELQPGGTHYVIRDGGSIVAFRVGSSPLADAGLVAVGTHTDSPTFRSGRTTTSPGSATSWSASSRTAACSPTPGWTAS